MLLRFPPVFSNINRGERTFNPMIEKIRETFNNKKVKDKIVEKVLEKLVDDIANLIVFVIKAFCITFCFAFCFVIIASILSLYMIILTMCL